MKTIKKDPFDKNQLPKSIAILDEKSLDKVVGGYNGSLCNGSCDASKAAQNACAQGCNCGQ